MLKLFFVSVGYILLFVPIFGFIVLVIWAIITEPIKSLFGKVSLLGNFICHAISGAMLSCSTIGYFYFFGYRTFWPALIVLNYIYWNNPGAQVSVAIEPELALSQKFGFGLAAIACLYFSNILFPSA